MLLYRYQIYNIFFEKERFCFGKLSAVWSLGKIPSCDGLDLASQAWYRLLHERMSRILLYPVVGFS